MKTIKIIDLIKNIQNENPIEKFKYRDELFVYDKRERDYKCSYRKPWFFKDWDWQWGLNDEVEIIEDKKVEHVGKVYDLTDFHKNYPEVAEMLRDLANKTIEIIDYINKEKE